MIVRVLFVLAIFLTPVRAEEVPSQCFAAASQKYGTPMEILVAIGLVESGLNNDAINQNSNGSRDVCAMQINSWWLPKIEEYGITEDVLRNDPCTCVAVGAWILAQGIESHGPTWGAVGVYHSPTLQHQRRYVRLVKSRLTEASTLVKSWRLIHNVNE
jgi:soluble lytic murein transglycosylase-like protein